MKSGTEQKPARNECAKCGACTVPCPVFQISGKESHSARGRLHLLSRLDPSSATARFAEILSQCLLCGACRSVCSRGMDPPAIFLAARTTLHRASGQHRLLRKSLKTLLASPLLLSLIDTIGLPLLESLPGTSGLRLRLGLPLTENFDAIELRSGHNTTDLVNQTLNLFTGCYAGHLRPDICRASQGLLKAASGGPVGIPSDQCCCGLLGQSSGDMNGAKQLAKQNIIAFSENHLPIVVSCASCYSQLCSYPSLFSGDPLWSAQAQKFTDRLVEFSTYLVATPKTRLRFSAPHHWRRVSYHDPCHLRFHQKIIGPPRELLQMIPDLCLVEPTDGPKCCGQGGLFHLAQPELADQIRKPLIDGLRAIKPDLVVSTCSGCLIQINHGFQDLGTDGPDVRHLALLLEECLSRE